ncbi:hypothetical protein ACLMAB_25430 [Brevibacillus laterosporus]
MSITITPQALAWFKKDWGFKSGDSIRFFVRYGGVPAYIKAIPWGFLKPNRMKLHYPVRLKASPSFLSKMTCGLLKIKV